MFDIKKRHICFAFICVTFVVTLSSANDETVAERPCNLAFRCTNEGPGVWAINDGKCFVYPNGCQLASVNCNRENNYQEKLEVVSKEVCQKLCPSTCTDDYTPVCGEYKGKQRQFSNQCVMDTHVCTSGEIYSLYSLGECNSSS